MKSKFTGCKLFGGPTALTERHLDILSECHRREVLNKEPLSLTDVGQIHRLTTTKVVDTAWYTNPDTGKKIMALKITPLGIDVIENPSNYM